MTTLPIRAAGGSQSSSISDVVSPTPFSESVLAKIMFAYRHSPSQDGQHFTDEASFLSYMASDKSSAMADLKSNDLSFPLSSYYISSSHNTYLSGHQLYGDASVDAYKNVLKRGCRCLEIDVWDGDSDSETSSSDAEEEQGGRHGRPRSDSKPSRWNRVKARAARMRSRSPSGSLLNNSQPRDLGPFHNLNANGQNRTDAASGQSEKSIQSPGYLHPPQPPSVSWRSEPQVLHGYTLTQPVSFRSVCQSIKDSAFLSTDLPIIVSLEVHACLTQQEMMVDIMRDIWSGLLVDISTEKDISVLPSPESLKRKILIKVKWTTDPDTGESNNPVDQVVSNPTSRSTEDGTASSIDKREKASKVLKALSELGVYTRAYSFKHFAQPEASIPTHVFSLSESKVHSMHSDPLHGPALFGHNKKYLMRVFPKGSRITSSNVDPTFHWRQGAQMVALNWQKLDKGMMLNEGMFTGTNGWILKPEGYRCNEEPPLGSDTSAVAPKRQCLNLEIRLLAAQRLPLPPDKDASYLTRMKPYIKIQLHVDTHGPPGQGKNVSGTNPTQVNTDTGSGEEVDDKYYKRRSATSRSDCPVFGHERMRWLNVSEVVEELSFVRYVIFLVTWPATIPFCCENKKLSIYPSLLIVGFDIPRSSGHPKLA
ncbi:hypothetical protein A1O1_05602 [Capronia coronata CBS 617.96]|uniref:Phosphoinositide phospholipase C n=1 Tax=Capronia coronata CBS 617.96 TaxID=1182541 RepID=W9YHD0_9EURO|nr:uncharacterized protein A1O1_05602 [Capronia coronata CBS 617.96]EXJ88671.1 hypothetical protein A1O1_05602 [Capronia coronata CBS 617.96]